VEQGCSPRYFFFTDLTGRPIGHHVVQSHIASACERLMAIKGQNGATDTRLHKAIVDAGGTAKIVILY
jgi:hypothetical protein